MTLVRCGFGLGNRVAAMANGLSRASRIQFVWRNNRHCPLDVGTVFPRGVQGVEFVDAPPSLATKWDGMMCHDWAAAADRERAGWAYAMVVASMAGRAFMRPDLAVCGRFFRADGDPDFLGDFASRFLRPGMLAYVFADRHRERIADRLAAAGAVLTFPTAPPLDADLDRSPEATRAFLDDWATLLNARQIIALDGPTSLLHPARAAGIPIHYAEAASEVPVLSQRA